MAQALAHSAAGDSMVPPVAPPSPIKPQPEPSPIVRYTWTVVVREWVRAPSVWMGATPAQEAAYLEHWRQIRVAEERRDGEYLEMLERDLEEEQRVAEEEARQAAAAQGPHPPSASALPAPAQPDMATL